MLSVTRVQTPRTTARGAGHLAMFWNDVQHSIWLNGPEDKGDGGLHERGPYWLNGFVPLAYQLKARPR